MSFQAQAEQQDAEVLSDTAHINNASEFLHSSPFDVIENNDSYKDSSIGEKKIPIVRQTLDLSNSEYFPSAELRFLSYTSGISSKRIVSVHNAEEYEDGISIHMHECYKEIGNGGMYPIYFALLSIKRANHAVFDGWIFSGIPSLASPKVGNYFIFLSKCIER